ncbi:KIR protein [Plasmodium coatneyi]|uniref:KIR protein n=1 Tax=Plasmodium coatneyi TaxID=208452 RepID=A0A1B1DX13_9APIC|nr:KIR protein [Plasmodium coatneyi]ANQ07294.1 KIR protein [Plasmodium coatneyi]
MQKAWDASEGIPGILGGTKLSDLPSRQMYYKFDSVYGTYKSIYNNVDTIEGKLRGFNCIDSDIEKILYAWYYVFMKESVISPKDAPCYYLYYYIGNILWSGTGGKDLFLSHMRDLYTALKGDHYNEKCELIHKNEITEATFITRKKIFDYSKDHDTIKQQILDSAKDKYKCTETYLKYLEDILTTYDTMKASCPENGASSSSPSYDAAYCTEFNKMFKEYKHEEMMTLKSQLVKQAKSASADASSFMESSEVNIPVAVSSILGVMGLPALGYFIYKVMIIIKIYTYYTSLPSLISNTLSSGGRSNRKRRSTERPFNRFLDDSTTEYTTDNSTIESVAESTTTDDSTLYNDGRRRRGGRNRSNTRPRNVAYQRIGGKKKKRKVYYYYETIINKNANKRDEIYDRREVLL